MLKKNTTRASSLSQRLHYIVQTYWHIVISIAVVAIVGLWLAYVFRNQINPDGISYIQVARSWAAFDIKQAINGYWAPLLSWLLVPALWLNIDPLFAFRALNFLVALIPVILLPVLMLKKTTNHSQRAIQALFLVSFGILLQLWASQVITPDLLSGVVLFLTLLCIHQFVAHQKTSTALLLGICVSLLYFSKSIGFYIGLFIVAALTLYGIYNKHAFILKKTLIVFVIFMGISVLWIAALSLKYDKITVSTAGDYNFSLIGPDQPAHPQTLPGYLETHYQNSVTAWDDPSYFNLPKWSILEHKTYYFNYLLGNANKTFEFFFGLSPLIVVGAWSLIATSSQKKRQRADRVTALITLGSIFLVCAAYIFVLVESRYLWFVAISVIASAFLYLVNISQEQKQLRWPLIIALTAFLVYSFYLLVPIYQNRYPAEYERNGAKYVSNLAKSVIPIGSKIAGPGLPMNFCFFSNTRCVGNYQLSSDSATNAALIQTMQQQDIDYYIEFSDKREDVPMSHIASYRSSVKSCYNYIADKTLPCGVVSLSIYKVPDNRP